MSVGIVRYPGSNCDSDTLKYFEDSFFIWHNEDKKDENFYNNLKLLVIPGGFAFGDRIYSKATCEYQNLPGIQAINSPVTKIIMEVNKRNIPILGICNGFQILIHLNLLPGKLSENLKGKFYSEDIKCVFSSFFFGIKKKNVSIPIANKYGKYIINFDEFKKMENNDQIFLKYKDFDNGSFCKIAGISNKEHTVFGMMPHPERIKDSDNREFFKNVFLNILNYKKNKKSKLIENNIIKIMSSEHVSYKSTKKFLNNLYTQEEHVIQGPGENAGIIDIGNGYCLAARIESHNHPIFINPFEGASTGVGGIIRDIFTMGARPIALLDFLRFGIDKNSENLIRDTIKGISYYGNCIGIPNVGGDFYKNICYDKNPLLNVACLGIVKKENIILGNALTPGYKFIYVGSKTGNDGIGGADMASQNFKSNMCKDTLQENIQKGDPFLEKLLLEACQEITEQKLVEGMQDMGAGGILCASVEMIQRGIKKTNKTLGCKICIDKIPLKNIMNIEDIIISESQERMLLVCSNENINKINKIFEKWDLEYSVVGEVTDNSKYTLFYNDEEVYTQEFSEFVYPEKDWKENDFKRKDIINKNEKVKNINLWKEYDNTIGCRTIKGPLEPGSYSILDLPEINKYLVLTWGTFEECLNEMRKNNGTPKAIINCLNFGSPEFCIKEIRESIEKLNNNCIKNKIPIIGGNVSLYNTTDNISINPTVILLMIGLKEK